MAKVIAVANQKGGCGKTSVTANLGIGLAMAGEKVLLIDADPQGSLTVSLGYPDPDNIPQTLATIMMGIINEEEFPKEFAMLHHEEDVDIVPANMELSGLEVSLSNAMSREMILKEYIDSVRDEYSYILIGLIFKLILLPLVLVLTIVQCVCIVAAHLSALFFNLVGGIFIVTGITGLTSTTVTGAKQVKGSIFDMETRKEIALMIEDPEPLSNLSVNISDIKYCESPFQLYQDKKRLSLMQLGGAVFAR